MARQSDDDLLDAVVICQGNIGDPGFDLKFMKVVKKLNSLVCEDYRAIKVRKVEPWNSVRVTLSLPRDAAQKLRLLAQQGDMTLRELGILSVQVEGDQVISLTIAGQYNEPQEIILHTEDRPVNPPCQDSVCDNQTPSNKSMVQLIVEASASGSVSGGEPSGLYGSGSEQFRSPNVVVPQTEPVPFPKNNGPSARLGTNYGPFPFTSMTHAAHAMQSREVHNPVLHNRKHISPPPPYPGTCNSSGVKVQDVPHVSIVNSSTTSNAPVDYNYTASTESTVLTSAYTSTSSSINTLDQTASGSGSLLVNLLQSDHTSGTAESQKSGSFECHRHQLNEDSPRSLPVSCNSSPARHTEELITYAVSRHSNQSQLGHHSNFSKLVEIVPSSHKLTPAPKSVNTFKNHQKAWTHYQSSGHIDTVQSPIKFSVHNKGPSSETLPNFHTSKLSCQSTIPIPQSRTPMDFHSPTESSECHKYEKPSNKQTDAKTLKPCEKSTIPISLDTSSNNVKLVNHSDSNVRSVDACVSQVQTKAASQYRESSIPSLSTMDSSSHQYTSSGKQRQFLINPLTGHLEPAPTDSSSDSETEIDIGVIKNDSTKSPDADKEHSDSELLLKSVIGKQPKKKTYLERSKSCDDNTVSESGHASGEKIKLKLKLGKKEPITASYCLESNPLNARITDNSLFGLKHSNSGSGLANSEGGIPPLRISLRGKNAAVVVGPRIEMDEKSKSDIDLQSTLFEPIKNEQDLKYIGINNDDDKPPKFKPENILVKYRSRSLKKLSSNKTLSNEMLSHFDFKNDDASENSNQTASEPLFNEISSKVKERKNKCEKLPPSSDLDSKAVLLRSGVQKNILCKSDMLKSTLESTFGPMLDVGVGNSMDDKSYKLTHSGVSEVSKQLVVDSPTSLTLRKTFKAKTSLLSNNQTSDSHVYDSSKEKTDHKLNLLPENLSEVTSVPIPVFNSNIRFPINPVSTGTAPVTVTNKSAMIEKELITSESVKCPDGTSQGKDYFNQGNNQGDDSGIESMDTQSEKSPNQGESPVRKDDKDVEINYQHNKVGETKNISQSKNERNEKVNGSVLEDSGDVLVKKSDIGQPSECNSNTNVQSISSSEVNIIKRDDKSGLTCTKTSMFPTQSLLSLLQRSKVLEDPVPDHSESVSHNATPISTISSMPVKNTKLDTVISRRSASPETKTKIGSSKSYFLLPIECPTALSSHTDTSQLNGCLTDHEITEHSNTSCKPFIDTSVPKGVPSTVPLSVDAETHSKGSSVILSRPYVINHGTKIYPVTLPAALRCDHGKVSSSSLEKESLSVDSSNVSTALVTSSSSIPILNDTNFRATEGFSNIPCSCSSTYSDRVKSLSFSKCGNCPSVETPGEPKKSTDNHNDKSWDVPHNKSEDYSLDSEVFSPIIEDPQPVHKNPPRYTYGSSTKSKEPLSPLDLGNCSDEEEFEEDETIKCQEIENVPSMTAPEINPSSPVNENCMNEEAVRQEQEDGTDPALNDSVATDHNYVTRSKHTNLEELVIEIPSDSVDDMKRPTRSSSRNIARLSSPVITDVKSQESSVIKKNGREETPDIKNVIGSAVASVVPLAQPQRVKRKRNDSDSSETSKCSESSKKGESEIQDHESSKFPKRKTNDMTDSNKNSVNSEDVSCKKQSSNKKESDKNIMSYPSKEEDPSMKSKTLRNVQSDNQEQTSQKGTSKSKINKDEEPRGGRKLKDIEKGNARGLCKMAKLEKQNVELNKRDIKINKESLAYKTYIKKDLMERNNICDRAFGNKSKVKSELEAGSKRQTRSSGSTGQDSEQLSRNKRRRINKER